MQLETKAMKSHPQLCRNACLALLKLCGLRRPLPRQPRLRDATARVRACCELLQARHVLQLRELQQCSSAQLRCSRALAHVRAVPTPPHASALGWAVRARR